MATTIADESNAQSARNTTLSGGASEKDKKEEKELEAATTPSLGALDSDNESNVMPDIMGAMQVEIEGAGGNTKLKSVKSLSLGSTGR